MSAVGDPPAAPITIVVAAAVIRHGEAFLVTKRQTGVHLEGFWEFPGGKCEAGETIPDCLAREILEELAVGIRLGEEIFTTTHVYPDRRVELHFLTGSLVGDPAPQQGQEMRWVRRQDLAALPFPPADAELIQRLVADGARLDA